MTPSDSVSTSPPQRWFTRKQAAALTGHSIDTLKRRERAGQLPSTRTRPGCSNGTIEYAYLDLVNAGLCEPVAAGEDPDLALRVVEDERRHAAMSTELAELRGRTEADAALITALRDEIRHLRRITDKLAGGGR